MWYRDEIMKAGKKLAALNPNATELKVARRWWKEGTTYSNQDFDILSALNQAIWKIETKLQAN